MKRKAYTITGQSFTKPADLPEGYTVEETEADDPRCCVVTSTMMSDVVLEVRPSANVENRVEFIRRTGPNSAAYVTVTYDSARQVRDCLTAILGDEPKKLRVYEDSDGDEWRENANGTFDCDHGCDEPIGECIYKGWTLARMQNELGHLKELA